MLHSLLALLVLGKAASGESYYYYPLETQANLYAERDIIVRLNSPNE